MALDDVVYRIGDDVEYYSKSHSMWIATKVIEVHHSGTKVKLKCKKDHHQRLSDGNVRKVACAAPSASASGSRPHMTLAAVTGGRLSSRRKSERKPSDPSPPASSVGSLSHFSAVAPSAITEIERAPEPITLLLDKKEEQEHRELLRTHAKEIAPAEIVETSGIAKKARLEIVEVTTGSSRATGSKRPTIASRIPNPTSLPASGFAFLAGKRKKQELARRKSEEEDEQRRRHKLRRFGSGEERGTPARARSSVPATPPKTPMQVQSYEDQVPRHRAREESDARKPLAAYVKERTSTGKKSHFSKSRHHNNQGGRTSHLVRRDKRRRNEAEEPIAKRIAKKVSRLASCTSRDPVIGDTVMSASGDALEDMGWMLDIGQVATVTEVDGDYDFKLRNPNGMISKRFIMAKHFVYCQEGNASKRKERYDVSAVFSEEEAPSQSTRQNTAADRHQDGHRARTERQIAMDKSARSRASATADVGEDSAKKRAKAKTQATRPKPQPPPAPAPAPAAAPAAEPVLKPLGKEGKQVLQDKIDLLEEDYLETVLRFLESDLMAEDGEEINLDLDKLAPHRQHQLVKVVDEEIAKQRAKQDAHARGERTPPGSPIFDIGNQITTPLQSAQPTPIEPAMSPLHLEAAAKNAFVPPFATPTPFPTPSECGEEVDPTAVQRHHVGEPAQPQDNVAATSAASSATSTNPAGQSVRHAMEETISRQVRKAVKATPELTESKTPRQQGPSASPTPKPSSGSPKTRARDSMLDEIDEADLESMLADEEPGGGKAQLSVDIEPADAQRMAASATGISTVISGESYEKA